MKKRDLVLAVSLALAAAAIYPVSSFYEAGKAYAQQQETQKLDGVKEKILRNLDRRIGMLQEAKVCVSSAATFEALQKCKPEHGRDMKNK